MFGCKECVVKFLCLQPKLVFGYNPSFPSVIKKKLPTLEGVTLSELVASHLNTLHSARTRLIETEPDKKLRRQLKHKRRTATRLKYLDRRSNVLQEKRFQLLERSCVGYWI